MNKIFEDNKELIKVFISATKYLRSAFSSNDELQRYLSEHGISFIKWLIIDYGLKGTSLDKICEKVLITPVSFLNEIHEILLWYNENVPFININVKEHKN